MGRGSRTDPSGQSVCTRKTILRLLAPLCSTVIASAGLTVIVATPTPAHAATGHPATMLTPEDAVAQAQATGKPVEVTSETTATDQVMANPNGSLTLNAASGPVRVRKNGMWVPIDTTLIRDLDGSWSPSATTEALTVSGGGSQALVGLSNGTEQVAFSWPSALPAPSITGPTATYSSVLPGVDLVLTAFSDHYSETLVVHDASGATQLLQHGLALVTQVTGLNLAPDGNGGLAATDRAGNLVFSGQAPIMWDSSQDPHAGPPPTATDPGGAHITKLVLSAGVANAAGGGTTRSSINVSLPSAAFTGSGIVYPLYVDPSIQPSMGNMAVVFSSGAPYYNSAGGALDVGNCGWPGCNGIGVARSYFQFDTSPLAPRNGVTAHVYTAQVQADEIWNADGCTATSVTLYSAGYISTATKWGGPYGNPLQTDSSANGGSSSCPAGYLTFNNGNVVSWLQTAASVPYSTDGFGLISGNESSIYYWKKFADSGAVPILTVNYAFAPSWPTAVGAAGAFSCAGTNYVTTSVPTLYGQAHDNNGGYQLSFAMWLYNSAGSLLLQSPWISGPSDTANPWTINSATPAALADASNYYYQVLAQPQTGLAPEQQSGWSPAYYFTVSTTPPTQPQVSSYNYPPSAWGSPAGTPGQITFSSTASGLSAAVGFAYAFDGTPTLPGPGDCNDYTNATNRWLTASGGTATLNVPVLSPGPHVLSVQAFSAAHNISQVTNYTIYVAPNVAGESGWYQEAENLTWSNPAGTYLYKAGPWGFWSGNYAESLVGNAPNQTFNATFSVPIESDYALGLWDTYANHFPQATFSVDGQQVTVNGATTVNTYAANPTQVYLNLGGLHLKAGSHTLSITAVGTTGQNYNYNGTYGGVAITNYNDNGYSQDIDSLLAVPINAATYTSINAAMNDHAIAADNTTQTSTVGYQGWDFGGNNYLSSQALTAAGFGAGQTVTVDPGTSHQATFTMPQPNADGTNVVISDGQTINLPSPVNAGTVDILAFVACAQGPNYLLPYTPTSQFTITHSNGIVQNAILPSVPGTVSGVFSASPYPDVNDSDHTYPQGQYISLAGTPSYYDTGTTATPTTSGQPKLYHLSIPVTNTNPPSPVTSVTLPYVGTTFVPGCPTPVLGVLAITTSTAATPTSDQNIVSSAQIEGAPASCPSTSGALEQFWNYNGTGTVYTDTQTAPNGNFNGNLSQLGSLSVAAGRPVVANNNDGSLLVAVTGQDGKVYTEQSDPCGIFASDWTALTAPPGGAVGTPALALNQNGDMQIAVNTASGTVYTQAQTSPHGGFGGTWSALPGVPSGAVGNPSMARAQNGELQIVINSSGGTTYLQWQNTPGGAFNANNNSWAALPQLTNIPGNPVLASNQNGLLQVAVTASNGTVYSQAQTQAPLSTDSGFDGPNQSPPAGWTQLAGISAAVGDPALVLNQNGTLQIAANTVSGTIGVATETAPNTAFGSFASLGQTPPGATSGNNFAAYGNPTIATDSNGALQITTNTTQPGIIYTEPETSGGVTAANGTYSNTWGYT